MKHRATSPLLLLLTATSVLLGTAKDAAPILHHEDLPLIAAPGFTGPLDATFHVAKGKWAAADGVLTVLDLPEEKHIPVLHHQIGLSDAVIELEFFLEGPGSLLVGCDSDKHIGRVVVNGTGLSIAEDSEKPSHTLAKLPLAVKSGEWHHLRVEWKGETMAANLDGHELTASHPFLGTAKKRSWIAAGKVVKIRQLRIEGRKVGE